MRPTVKLWEIVTILNWRAYSQNELLSKWKYPVLRVGNFFTNSNWYYSDLELEDDKYCNNWDLLYAWSASFWPKIWEWWKTIYHYHIWKIKLSDKIDKHYLYHYLYWDSENIKRNWHWVAMMHVTKWDMEKKEIPLPPLETQKAIVAKLDQIFAELDQTKSEIQKNLDNTDELWKSAYDLKIEELKEKYWLKKLEEICSLITDWSHFSPKTTTKWLPYITVKDIDDEWNIDTENSKKISEEDFAVLVQNWCQPKKWDVLYSKDGTIWKIHLVNDEIFVVLSSLAIIRPWKDVKSEYLYQIFHSNFFEKQAVWNKTWAAIKRIVLKTIKSLQIPVPPLSEQEKIIEHLDQVSKEVKALKSQYQSQLDNLEELKKSVLDKAFRWE